MTSDANHEGGFGTSRSPDRSKAGGEGTAPPTCKNDRTSSITECLPLQGKMIRGKRNRGGEKRKQALERLNILLPLRGRNVDKSLMGPGKKFTRG